MEEIIVEGVETSDNGCNNWKWRKMHRHGKHGALYFLGFIGAATYYVQHADTFWIGVIGILKAIVWPAFLVYHVLAYLGV